MKKGARGQSSRWDSISGRQQSLLPSCNCHTIASLKKKLKMAQSFVLTPPQPSTRRPCLLAPGEPAATCSNCESHRSPRRSPLPLRSRLPHRRCQQGRAAETWGAGKDADTGRGSHLSPVLLSPPPQDRAVAVAGLSSLPSPSSSAPTSHLPTVAAEGGREPAPLWPKFGTNHLWLFIQPTSRSWRSYQPPGQPFSNFPNMFRR